MQIDYLHHVLAFGNTCGIFYRWGQHEQHRRVGGYNAVVEVAFHAQLALRRLSHARSDNRQRPPIDRELRRLGRSIVSHKHRAPGLVGFHAVQKGIAPGLCRSHIYQVFDVDRGNDCAARSKLFA